MFKKLDHFIDNSLDNSLGGHLNIGKVTIYGRNSMRWTVNISTKKYGYICFNLPIPIYWKIDSLYFYLSPNGTPWACTKYYGRDKELKKISKLRYESFGHGFDTDVYRDELNYINNNEELPLRIQREREINKILKEISI